MTSKNDSGESSEASEVRQHLEGKHILIIGATGFLGKVLLEKLIRTVPEIGGITLLIRGNNSHGSARDRFLKEIAASSVFDRLRQNEPERFERFCSEKIYCVTGEVTQPRFGLSDEAFAQLAQKTDAVVNSAASVNFRQEIDLALSINTLCLQNIAEIAEKAGNVPLIHVSTCYVHGSAAGEIREEFTCPPQAKIPRDSNGTYRVEGLVTRLQQRAEAVKKSFSGERLKRKLVDLGTREARGLGWNDAYTMTKWAGEQMLARRLSGRPLTILRPSIIESTLKEPVPGWIEGIKVADIMIMAYARGKVVFFPARRAGVADIIPADLVANSIIISLAEQLKTPSPCRIYQCCSGSSNPLTIGELIDLVVGEARENHASYPLVFPKPPGMRFTAVNRHLFRLASRLLAGPVRGAEVCMKTMGRSANGRALEKFRTTMKLADIFGLYSCPCHVFYNDRLMEAARRMKKEDRALFPVDPRSIDWPHYIRKTHLSGLNRYALE
ncbi:MAG: fatty acyl-CoA reductase [Thermodesulfobacteriota bacterium]